MALRVSQGFGLAFILDSTFWLARTDPERQTSFHSSSTWLTSWKAMRQRQPVELEVPVRVPACGGDICISNLRRYCWMRSISGTTRSQSPEAIYRRRKLAVLRLYVFV